MRWIVGLVFVLFAGGSVMNCDEIRESGALSRDEARAAAEKELASRLTFQPTAYREAAAGAVAAEPLSVTRLDVPGQDYLIVPFVRDGATTLIVLIDATDGSFREMSYMRDPGSYPAVTVESARDLVAEKTGKPATAAPARLVWKPSHLSQSPYEPFWEVEVDGTAWFVAQTGEVEDEIREPELMGGGPPPGPASF